MASVTQRIKMIKQPHLGYINPKQLVAEPIAHEYELHPFGTENIPPVLVGLAVDYLTRFYQGAMPREAFQISLIGYEFWLRRGQNLQNIPTPTKLLTGLKATIDPETVFCAVNLAQYDVYYRSGTSVAHQPEVIYPNLETAENIQKMVQLSDLFRKKFGPFILDGFNFMGGYTDIIQTGDGDFTTKDTLWDMKVSKNPPTKDHTLQLAIYYLMGLHSVHASVFQKITRLGIYNPRLNMTYTIEINQIPQQTWDEIAVEVIGY